MLRGRSIRMLALLAPLLAACDPADEVAVQPLPELERPSPEARAGLPEVAGVWRFAGWELAPDDSANLAATLPGLGELRLETQRLDSLAGSYVGAEGRLPVLGEVRRDSVVALAALLGAGEGRYIAGRVTRDTLWVTLSSLLPAEVWPDEGRAAFVRNRIAAAPFKRLEGAAPVQPRPVAPPLDSAVLAAIGPATTAIPPGPWPRAASPAAAPPATAVVLGASAVPPGPWPRAAGAPPAAPAPRPAETAPLAADEAEPEPEPDLPAPTPLPGPAQPALPVAPRDTQRPPPPVPLLGEPVRPVRPDTTRPDTSYSPMAAWAVARPRSVSASR